MPILSDFYIDIDKLRKNW